MKSKKLCTDLGLAATAGVMILAAAAVAGLIWTGINHGEMLATTALAVFFGVTSTGVSGVAAGGATVVLGSIAWSLIGEPTALACLRRSGEEPTQASGAWSTAIMILAGVSALAGVGGAIWAGVQVYQSHQDIVLSAMAASGALGAGLGIAVGMAELDNRMDDAVQMLRYEI